MQNGEDPKLEIKGEEKLEINLKNYVKKNGKHEVRWIIEEMR
jgi:hypothetical protein